MDTTPENEAPPTEATEATEAERDEADARRSQRHAVFAWEVCIFLLGIFIGYFWSNYARNTTAQGHMVIALLVFVLILIRYISHFVGR